MRECRKGTRRSASPLTTEPLKRTSSEALPRSRWERKASLLVSRRKERASKARPTQMFNRKLCHPSPYQIENNNLESSIDWGTVPVTLNHVCQRWKIALLNKVRAPEGDRISQLSIDGLLDKAFFSLPINEKCWWHESLCSTLSFLFHIPMCRSRSLFHSFLHGRL